jgi:hypothetical protein
VFVQRSSSLQVQRSQGRNGRRRHFDLLAQVLEQIGRHTLNNIQRAARHLEKPNL